MTKYSLLTAQDGLARRDIDLIVRSLDGQQNVLLVNRGL
jgi:hypothetical protein